jgi:hypothetical protein
MYIIHITNEVNHTKNVERYYVNGERKNGAQITTKAQ